MVNESAGFARIIYNKIRQSGLKFFYLNISLLSGLIFNRNPVELIVQTVNMKRLLKFSIFLILQVAICFPAYADIPQKITRTVQGITFDSNYDNGSLADVESAGEDVFNCDIFVENGELGSRKYWFRFTMTGVAGRSLILNLDHSNNPRPVIKTPGNPWRRLTEAEAPTQNAIYLHFEDIQNQAELAFFFPYGVLETYDRVNEYVRRCDDASSSMMGLSFQDRPMWMISITDHNVPIERKRRVWIHSRVHAGEVTGTLCMLGILDLATEDSILGRHLRENLIFNIVPLVNVDGVWLGHTRWDSQGIDPERQWGNPSRIPETENLQNYVDSFMSGPNPIELALNLHSTKGNFTDTFFFKHVYPSVSLDFEIIQQSYIDALDNATLLFDNRSPATSQLHDYQYIESYFWNNWGEAVMAMTHEGHFYRRITDNDWITDVDYHEIGRAMVLALLEYFDLPEPPSETSNRWMIY